MSTTPTLTRCPRWCTTPAHRLSDTLGMPTREDFDLAASEPHEGPVSGPSRSSDVEVSIFVEPDGTSGVTLAVAGEATLALPLSEAVSRLVAMSDALRGASEDLAVVLAGGVAVSTDTRADETALLPRDIARSDVLELVKSAEAALQAALDLLAAVEGSRR